MRGFNGRWLAVADLAYEPELGIGDSPLSALEGALCLFPADVRTKLRTYAERQLRNRAGSQGGAGHARG